MTPSVDEPDLAAVFRMMSDAAVRRVYAKPLAANDNSKNQPYFGGDFGVLNILPAGTPVPAATGSHARAIFKAPLKFSWLADDGRVFPAPNAKLILYPQYPEVRFSGYLQGCEQGPSHLMGTTRESGRLLLLGVRDDGMIIGYAAGPASRVARGFSALHGLQQFGVFVQLPFDGAGDPVADRRALLAELCRIAGLGWLRGRKLAAGGADVPCDAPNCGGYTLEAELGIVPNGYAEPDFRGWEVKQHTVADFSRYVSGPITLMTPEPSDGFYTTAGVVAFVKRYGYPDTAGRANRLNFGGTHRFEAECARTGLTLRLLGYDATANRITDAGGGIALVDRSGMEAAVWRYADVMAHWNRKHASAAYVPSLMRSDVHREYQYASRVRLGTGTDFLRFLSAVAEGKVYYDPGVKVENYPASPRSKRRSQFRIRSADLAALYQTLETVDTCAESSPDGRTE